MKTLSGFLLIALLTGPGEIARINSMKAEAKKAYLAGDYPTAIAQYRYLVDSAGVKEDEVLMNLAHSYFMVNDTAQAQGTYQPLSGSANTKIKSNAALQLGVLKNRAGKGEEALGLFKQSLKADPTNQDARHNYEMLKKKLDKKKKQEDQKNNKAKEPSAYAKKLKAEADLLVLQKQYQSAYDLMNNGLQKDQTVSYYQDFIERTKVVATIDK